MTDRPHVAPPASGDVSGRATGGELIDALLDAASDYQHARHSEFRPAHKAYLAAKRALLDHIVAMYAAGECRGVEKAAKVAEGHCPSMAWNRGMAIADDIASRIRALITKEAKP